MSSPRETTDAVQPAAQAQDHQTSRALLADSFPAGPNRGNEIAKPADVGGQTNSGSLGDAATKPLTDATQNAARDKALGLPSVELFDSQAAAPAAGGGRPSPLEAAQKTLADPKASATDKLNTVEQLAKDGVKNISIADADGKMRDYKVDVTRHGDRNMVHLWGKDDKGQDRIALRGIHNADGSYSQERDARGREVGFTGSKFAEGGGKSTVAAVDGTARPVNTGSGEVKAAEKPVVKPADTAVASPAGDATVAKPVVKPVTGADATGHTIDRSQFDSQLQDPRVMAAFAGRMRSEVGSQGKEAQVAFAEEVMNRAASRGQTLMQALSGKYYPTSHPGSSNNPEFIGAITKAWKEGTDTTHGATGNASGTVGFGGGRGRYENGQFVSPNQTVRFGGERFGHEQVDLNKGWLAKYDSLKRRNAIANAI